MPQGLPRGLEVLPVPTHGVPQVSGSGPPLDSPPPTLATPPPRRGGPGPINVPDLHPGQGPNPAVSRSPAPVRESSAQLPDPRGILTRQPCYPPPRCSVRAGPVRHALGPAAGPRTRPRRPRPPTGIFASPAPFRAAPDPRRGGREGAPVRGSGHRRRGDRREVSLLHPPLEPQRGRRRRGVQVGPGHAERVHVRGVQHEEGPELGSGPGQAEALSAGRGAESRATREEPTTEGRARAESEAEAEPEIAGEAVGGVGPMVGGGNNPRSGLHRA